ncbi:MAG: glucosaminidase domain-containing protein [Bacteroidota bacterium]|nr:glucosaminidase domain-containing protein [Bacteroidota bacterium]
MKRHFLLIIVCYFITAECFAQVKKRTSIDEYVNTYKDIAIAEMKRSGIPASITLAQGLLESENGNSRLAKEARNHFGIKCHNWKGPAIYQDDDTKNECFRKYQSAEESFYDHSEFLLSGQRYIFLFEYKPTDYESWARGLKRAGYATNPRYADMLIKLIQDNKLYVYDQGLASYFQYTPAKRAEKKSPSAKAEPDFTFTLKTRPVYKRNDVEYVIVKNGDTFEKLTKEFDKFRFQLPSYNDLPKDAQLQPGQIIYLQPKRRRAEKGNDFHTVQAGENIYTISQLYGIKIRHIRRLNRLDKDTDVNVGDVLYLRDKKPKN